MDLDVLLERLDADLSRSGADQAPPRDDAAWQEMRTRVSEKARTVARKPFARMTTPLSSLELEDVVQDVLIKLQLSKILNQVRHAGKPMGYLVQIIRNVAGDHLRGGLHRSREFVQADEVATQLARGSDQSLPEDILTSIKQRLSAEEYALYEERYVQGRSIGEIAASRSIKYGTANGRLRRLRARVRTIKTGPKMRKRGKRAVYVERLRAAHQASGLSSWHQLAQKSGVPHPTISRIMSSRGSKKAVRRATLQRLATALRVPAEWLTGERRDLPYVPERLPWARDEKTPSLWERPTADYVQWSWLMQGVERALRHDLSQWYGEQAPGEYKAWGHGVVAAIARLAGSMVWRSATLEPTPEQSWSELWRSDDAPSLGWLTHILDPWFLGKAYLNADVLRGILGALLSDSNVQILGSATGDADAILGLERYASARREFAPDENRFENEDES